MYVAEIPVLNFQVFNPKGVGPLALEARAQQLEYFTKQEIWPYYMDSKQDGGLGLEYIEENPYTPEDRIALLKASGSLSTDTATRHYVLGYEPGANGEPMVKGVDALRAVGIITLGACVRNHDPAEIHEVSVARSLRRNGLGSQLLATMLELVHDKDPVQLDVVAHNWPAHTFYSRLGIHPDPKTRLMQSDIFRATKQRFRGEAAGKIKSALARVR